MIKYAYPFKEEDKSRFDFYSTSYCYPYFHQDWRLFTPCPNYNFEIYASYEVDGKTCYAAPLKGVLEHGDLFNGGEFLKLAFTAAGGYIGYETTVQNGQIGDFPQGKSYSVMQTMVKNYLRHESGSEVNHLKMLLVLRGIKNNDVKYILDK